MLVPIMTGFDYLSLDSVKNVIEGVFRILVGRVGVVQSDHLGCSHGRCWRREIRRVSLEILKGRSPNLKSAVANCIPSSNDIFSTGTSHTQLAMHFRRGLTYVASRHLTAMHLRLMCNAIHMARRGPSKMRSSRDIMMQGN